jgi:O-antigen ligase
MDARWLNEFGLRSAHNGFLDILCETGLIGFICMGVAFGGTVLLLRRIRISLRTNPTDMLAVYAVGLEVGMYGWFADNCFMGDHELDPAYWFVALAVIMIRLYALRATAPAPCAAPAAAWVSPP